MQVKDDRTTTSITALMTVFIVSTERWLRSWSAQQVKNLRGGLKLSLLVCLMLICTGCQSAPLTKWRWVSTFRGDTHRLPQPPLELSADMLREPTTSDSETMPNPAVADPAQTIAIDESQWETPFETEASEQSVKLQLSDVTASALATFPELQRVYLERDIADGNFTAAMGAFDLNMRGQSVNQPQGFYRNYQQQLGLSQNLFSTGGNIYAGYRLGSGNFQPWYKERETNDGGEFAIGTVVPLRQNRLIDARRAAVFRADQDIQSIDPLIFSQEIQIVREATAAYWLWVGVGNALEAQRRLLDLALDRSRAINEQVERGDLPKLAGIDNDRLIAQREAKVVEARRKFEASTIKLAFFLRDDEGRMLLPEAALLPDFPDLPQVSGEQLQTDLTIAVQTHPEIILLGYQLAKAEIDVEEARNSILARVDVFAETSQDVGGAATPLRDKSQMEMEIGVIAELPLQRRFGLGRLTAAESKRRQWEWKREFAANKIQIAVQDAHSALLNARERHQKATENLRLARQSLEIGRNQFLLGDIDLIVLNIYEEAVATAELLVLDADVEFFIAMADYQLAMGRR